MDNIARGQFFFDPEATNTSKRGDSEISLFTNFIAHLSMMLVIVALLPRLSSLQVLANDANFFFSFIDHIRTKEWSFSGFGPIQRSSTSSSVESFKRRHAQTGLIAVVIREFGKWNIFLPILTEGDNTSLEHV